MYGKTHIDAHYFRTKGFYLFFIPVKVPYKNIYKLAAAAGLQQKQSAGPILERGAMFGSGWIGVEIEKPAASSTADIVHISGDFATYQHRGAYKTLGQAYKKIMKERGKAKEYYNLYLDDPAVTAPEDCRTTILFR